MNVIHIKTKSREEIVDITDEVRRAVQGRNGIALIYSLHTTTGIVINEAETGLMGDILERLKSLIPKNAGYMHDRIDSNADAHIKASLVGNSAVIPVENGKLVLGTWQRVLFLEFDGPRDRKVFVMVYEAEKSRG